MIDWNILAFLVFPYLSLAVFVLGHLYRYLKDPYHWNARSSELLEKDGLKYASNIFHYGIVLTFVGHFGGLLIPQAVFDQFGIHGDLHTRIAVLMGMLFGGAALVGICLLLWRRLTNKRVLIHSSIMDLVTSILLLVTIGLGTYNVFFGHFYVLDTVAPWIRSIITLSPEPGLMAAVPIGYKLHVLFAFTVFAVSPFTRLIHIWSVPIPYLLRDYIIMRGRTLEL
jgi:nitrate reductase gamma subunit